MPPKGSKSTKRSKKAVQFALTAAEECRNELKKAKKAPTASPKSSGMKTRMKKQGVPMKCAITGYKTDFHFLQCAHIFPDCWANPQAGDTKAVADMNAEELGTKFMIEKQRPLRLGVFLRRKQGRKKILDSVANRILLRDTVHTAFDIGRWTLVAKQNKKTKAIIPDTYEVVVKPDHVEDMKEIGVNDGATVKLPHVNPSLIAWHFASFKAFCPTAGAERRDGDDFSDDNDSFVHPDEVKGQEALEEEFLAQDQAICLHREPLPGHERLVTGK